MGNLCSSDPDDGALNAKAKGKTPPATGTCPEEPWMATVLRETPVKALIPREEKIEETLHTEGCAKAFEQMLHAQPPVYATPVWNEESSSYEGARQQFNRNGQSPPNYMFVRLA